jgi:quercetin dioxygenase-like cupin family protein
MTTGRSTGALSDAAPSWATLPVVRVSEAIQRQMIWGERVMVCRLTIAPHTVTAVHAHVHEQIVIVERGRARFVVDGSERIVGPGDVLHFPSGCQHGATMLDEEVVLIDIFSPIREDFLPSGTREVPGPR